MCQLLKNDPPDNKCRIITRELPTAQTSNAPGRRARGVRRCISWKAGHIAEHDQLEFNNKMQQLA